MEGVCCLRLSQRSLVDGLVGFECRLMTAFRWTPHEGPNSCLNFVGVVDNVYNNNCIYISFFKYFYQYSHYSFY